MLFRASLPCGSNGKESTRNVGDLGSIPGLGRSPGEGNGYPPQYLAWSIPWTEEPGGYSPWGPKESDMTEQLSLSLTLFIPEKWEFDTFCSRQ